ncbi:hypothetical protein MSAN_01654200 [Mycena sanguinolenta]|uniref:DUF4097 domain-containing protein n=1 Tax=Mycena sanguinolenta TaxID=230812 RepID=A0A8H7CWU1_9AGAR|nr:hypothetical protein MSAN_01654200 [Mycena sanguinolenta]
MIIDNGLKSPVDDSTPLLGDANAPNAPPAYTPPRADFTPMGDTLIPYAVYQPVYAQQGQQGQRRTGEPAGRRFCKAFLVVRGTTIIPSQVVLSQVSVRPPGRKKANPDFSNFPYSASTSFDFHLPSKSLLLLSKGGLSNGHLKITSSPNIANVRVKVTVNYWIPAVRDAAKVCFIERSEGEGGVGIFPWRSRTYIDRLFFDVELILPRSNSILHVNGLSTDVNNFSQDVDNLNAYFNDLSLKASKGKIETKSLTAAQAVLATSSAPVAVESLVAPIAVVMSSNGRITGTYAVVDSLTLKTSEGAINVTASITGNSSLEKTKDISMQTSNGPLNYVVDLGSTVGEAGSFRVKATTSNDKVTAKIVSAPLNSVLDVEARTSNHLASLVLPSTYEGSFAILTSSSTAAVSRTNPQEKDPACDSDAKCKGRKRTFYLTEVTESCSKGSIYWDSQNADRGSVVLGSSNGAATLYI